MQRAHLRLGLLLLISAYLYVPVPAAECRGYNVNINPNATIPSWPSDLPTNISVCSHDRYRHETTRFSCVYIEDTYFDLSQPAHCGTEYNTDYYGSGVRVGFYFAWWASFVANNFVPEEIAGAIDANSIFLFALAISVVKGTFYDRTFKTVDAVVMLLIGVGTTVGTMSLWGYRTCLYRLDGRNALRKFGGFGTYSRLLLCFCVNLFWLWFWYRPYRRLLGRPSCDPRCQIVWIFGRPVSNGIRFLLFVFGLIYQVYWGFMLFGIPITIVARLHKARERLNKRHYDRTSKLTYKIGLSHKQLRDTSISLAILNFLWLCFIIALTETTIHQNSASNVFSGSPQTSTPSQLIPLLIGITTFTRIAYLAFKTMRYGNDDVNPSLSEEQELADDNKDNETWEHDPPETWWRWFYVQSPKYKIKCSKEKQDEAKKQVGPCEDSRRFAHIPWWRRLLVTWLPWLGLYKHFLAEQKLEDFEDSLAQGSSKQGINLVASSGTTPRATTTQTY